MSFWRTFGLHTVSPIDTILDQEHFSLEELLDQDDFLTECKSQNKKLLDFLLEPETFSALFDYLLLDAPEDADEKRRYKYPYLACEVFCMEIWDISDAIFENTGLLDRLWGFLDVEGALNPLLCTYTTKVAGVMLHRKIQLSINYLQKKAGVVDKFIAHLENAPVMELLLKLIACQETPDGAGVLEWLAESRLIPQIISKLNPLLSNSVHENASQSIISIIEQTPERSVLLTELESEQNLSTLVKYIIESNSKSVLLNGLAILNNILERNTRDESDSDTTTALDQLPPFISIALTTLPSFLSILKGSPDAFNNNTLTRSVESTFIPADESRAGERILLLPTSYLKVVTPVGPERLLIVDFFASLIRLRYTSIDSLLLQSGIFNVCFDLFFNYHWNNFLHMGVRNMVADIFSGLNLACKLALLTECRLLDRLIEAARGNAADLQTAGGISRGYMGFVTQITNGIIASAGEQPEIAKILQEHADWLDYTSSLLELTNAAESADFGPRPNAGSSSDEDGDFDQRADQHNNPEIVTVFTEYLATSVFNSSYPQSFDDENDDDEYNDEDEHRVDHDNTNNELVLDNGFEKIPDHYSTDSVSPYHSQSDDDRHASQESDSSESNGSEEEQQDPIDDFDEKFSSLSLQTQNPSSS